MIIPEADEPETPEVLDGPQENGFLYINGEKQTAYKLVKYGEDYYFISDYNKYVVNKKLYITKNHLTNAALDISAGYYEFDAEGKMIIN